jgi:hypothetical protein
MGTEYSGLKLLNRVGRPIAYIPYNETPADTLISGQFHGRLRQE